MKIAYVILHYKVYSVTKECIEYLLKQNYENYCVIVIDNHSDDGSYEKLKEEFGELDEVYLTSVEFNLGFAKANDLGYQIAKHRFEADIIVVMNNDVMISDTEFSTKLDVIAKSPGFDIMGPDIVNKVGDHQNPYVDYIKNKKGLDAYIRKLKIKKILLPFFYRFKKNHDIKHLRETKDHACRQESVALHGACLIFGINFVKKYEYPFYPETFLYGEEDILYFLAKKRGQVTLYCPDLVVHHMEDVSTNSISKNRQEKRLFEISHTLDSLEILRKLMTNG